MEPRLYIIGRADLAPGLRAAQAGHAAFAFALEHPHLTKRWGNSYLILLEAEDLRSLQRFLAHTKLAGLTTSEWHEPDLDDQLTAVAIAPSEASKILCSEYPLMLHEPHLDSSTARASVSKTEDEGSTPSPGSHPRSLGGEER